MLTLHDDGSLSIDFGDGPPTLVRAPRFGAFKRLRVEAQRLTGEQQAKLDELRAPVGKGKNAEPLPAAEVLERFSDFAADTTVRWWTFALTGDETFKGLAEGTVPDADEWPAWMVEGVAIGQVMNHWRSVPLARGGQAPTLLGPALAQG